MKIEFVKSEGKEESLEIWFLINLIGRVCV